MADPLHVVRVGPPGATPLLFIHGSATDHATWTIQLASSLRERFMLISYDRRGTGGSPGSDSVTVEQHADDAAGLAEDAPVIVIGSSFGAVIALDLVRRYPDRVRGAVLCEPPMGPTDQGSAGASELLVRFEQVVVERGGEAAAELFLRTVLGDASYDKIPRAFQDRSKAHWRAIRADSRALVAYRPRYAELARVTTPVLLLGGDRSAAYFRPTLEALRDALGAARLEILAGAGHMLHADAARTFNARIAAFADELGYYCG